MKKIVIAAVIAPFIAWGGVGVLAADGSLGDAVAPPGKALPAPNTPITHITFGSDLMNREAPALRSITAQAPDLMVFLGDNVFGLAKGDPTMPEMRQAYQRLASDPDFRALRAAIPTIETWDDHDFGVNDGGADSPYRATAKKLFSGFWGLGSRIDGRDGVYDAYTFGPKGERVQVILLDTRYDRSPLTYGPNPAKARYVPSTGPDQRMLSEAQWRWFEQKLREPADIRLIGSSIQVMADDQSYEAWKNLPAEQARLYKLIRDTHANGVIFLSGDRVVAGLYKIPGLIPYPAHEITSSSLNLTFKEISGKDRNDEASTGQQEPLYMEPNFGRVDIDWQKRSVSLQVRGEDGHLVQQTQFPINELSAAQ